MSQGSGALSCPLGPHKQTHTLEFISTLVNPLHFLECIGSIWLSDSEPRFGIETDQAISNCTHTHLCLQGHGVTIFNQQQRALLRFQRRAGARSFVTAERSIEKNHIAQ